MLGAGKTRAAAAVLVGLIVIYPGLTLMVYTKENAAAQAFAEHVVGFGLPEEILGKFSRLVGFMEVSNWKLQRGT